MRILSHATSFGVRSFGSEICYCILSLTAKLFLGTVILFNVIMAEGRANDSLGAGGLQPAR